MRTCTVIADADTVVGFRLAGVEAVAAAGPEEAERLLRERIGGAETAIVLVNQAFFDGFSPALRHKIEKLGLPLVIPIPISHGGWREERSEDYILGIIRRAIGFQMKIGRP
jgi:vacuolar-type H+-ATPase subunit F/Vma7